MSRIITKLTVGLTSLALLVGGILWFQRSGAAAQKAPVQHSTSAVERGHFVWKISATGVVEPKYSTEIRSKASGTIQTVNVEVGNAVKPNQSLLQLDPEIEKRRVNQAKAELSMAYADYNKSHQQYKHTLTKHTNTKKLFGKGLVSKETLDNLTNEVALRKAERSSAWARVKRSKEALKEASDRLKDTKIIAPEKGIILQRLVQPGQVITSGTNASSGGTLLFKMADLSQLYVRGHVDEADVVRVKDGQRVEVTIDALPGKMFSGQVVRVNPEGKSENSVTVFEVLVKLDKKASKVMKINMTTNLKIVVDERENAMLVPAMAVKSRGNRHRVMVLSQGKVQRKRVQIGPSNGTQTVILKGLSETDKIITSQITRKKSNRKRRGSGRNSSMRNMRRMMRR